MSTLKHLPIVLAGLIIHGMTSAQDCALDHSFEPANFVAGVFHSTNIQPDGKIVAGGFFFTDSIWDGKICRMHPDGSMDATFHAANVSGFILTTALQVDGKILAGGRIGNGPYNVERLLPDGASDPTFDPGSGANHDSIPFQSAVHTIALQDDGKILIGGGFTSYNGIPRKGIARLHPDGSLDTSFDPGSGVENVWGTGEVTSVAIQPDDGKIIVGGGFSSFNGTPRNGIARLHPDGSLDTSFNHPWSGAALFCIAIQPEDNKILCGGLTYFGESLASLTRLNPDGSLDEGFMDGLDITNFDAPETITSIALQPNDGKIIVGGRFTSYSGTTRNGIARLHPNGSLDMGFDPGSGLEFANDPTNSLVYSIALQPTDGKVVIGGAFDTYNGTDRMGIARLHHEGTTGFANLDQVGMGPYPNPTSGVITLLWPSQPQARELVVFDATGRLVITQSMANVFGPVTLDMSDASHGVYTLQVLFADGSRTVERVMKE